MYFRYYTHRKAWLNKSLKSPLSEEPSTSIMVRDTKHCWNLNGTTFTIFLDSCEVKWVGKKTLLLMFKFLRLLLNILTFDDQYSPPNRDNFRQPIQLQLSQKQKIFSRFFCTFLKSIFKLEQFQKKDQSHSWYISEMTESEIRS